MATNFHVMRTASSRFLLLVSTLLACRAQPVPDGDSATQAADQVTDTTTTVPGRPAAGMRWVESQALRLCEEPSQSTEGRTVAWPDSTTAVAAARRALGARVNVHTVVSTLTRTSDGVFIQFTDSRAGVVDGSASVYVQPGPCVTLLGW